MFELNKSFPDFGFFEDKYFDNLPEWHKKLVEVIVRNDISVTVINTDQ